jgi:hypothetical protein
MSLEKLGVFQLIKEVFLSLLYHSSTASLLDDYAHHSSDFFGLSSQSLQIKENFGIIIDLKSGTRVPAKLGILVFQVIDFHYNEETQCPVI